MPVKVIRRDARCKICNSDHVVTIDDMLEMRYRHQRIGKEVVQQRHVLAKMREVGIENPTIDNINTHSKKHIEFVDTADEAEAPTSEQEQRLAIVVGELGEGWEDKLLSIDEFLRFYVAIESRNLVRDYVKNGNLQGAQLERLFKGAAEMTRRKSDSAAADLASLFGAAAEDEQPEEESEESDAGEL
jgi:hypothetical protein